MSANESFENAIAPEPVKRKRSSILKQPDKRTRDSRTVSFNDKNYYRELYQDGTYDITNFFLGEDMDITMMDIVDPIDCNNQTIDNSVDMSMDQTIVGSQSVDITLVPLNDNQSIAGTTTHHDTTLDERDMISESSHLHHSHRSQHPQQPQHSEQQQPQQPKQQPKQPQKPDQPQETQQHEQPQQPKQQQQPQLPQQTQQPQPQQPQKQQQPQQQQHNVSQHNASQHHVSQHNVSQHNASQHNASQHHVSQHHVSQHNASQHNASQHHVSQISQLSEISSLDDTLFGANNLSTSSNRSSGVETLMHNMEALNDCIHKVDQDNEECRLKLDAEIDDLFKFYRHIVNKDNPYEFAVAIFGLRHSLWLIIKIDPDTYPNEKLKLRFAVSKKDRHLYPFREYAQAVERYTKEGTYDYLKRFVISAQKFRRFLKKIGYGKTTARNDEYKRAPED